MLEPLYCRACSAYLVTTNLEKFHKVTVTCKQCGYENVYEYDPTKIVKKRKPEKGQGLFEETDGV